MTVENFYLCTGLYTLKLNLNVHFCGVFGGLFKKDRVQQVKAVWTEIVVG
jgi:hypothetical protein